MYFDIYDNGCGSIGINNLFYGLFKIKTSVRKYIYCNYVYFDYHLYGTIEKLYIYYSVFYTQELKNSG